LPSLPAAGEAVTVTARVNDPDGVQSLVLKYRIDPKTTYSSVTMTDDGTGADAIAGDGIYSGRIPGQSAQTIVAFYLQAADAQGATTRFPADLANNGPIREALICFGDNPGTSAYGAYHLWLTQSTISRWSSLGDMSNEPHDGTFVSGSRIIYNMLARYAGSPYHQQFDSPVGSQCHYHCEMPEDDQFLGTTSFNKIHAPGNGPFDDNTLQREQTSYWLVRNLGLPWNYRRYVAMYVNGNRRGTLMEDTQVPNSDVIDEHFPNDTDGQLFKLQPWFEFDANGQSFNNNSWCTLNNYTTTGGAKKLARYRWNYLARAAGTTMNDYTNVFRLTDAANLQANSSQFLAAMDSQVDTEQWMRTFAVEHAVGNWDSFGAGNAQNMYGYKPESDKWNLMIWDYNIVLGNSGSWGPGENLLSYNGADVGMGHIYSTYAYLRAYWRAMKELVNGPMQAGSVNPVMDAKFQTFIEEGLQVTAPQAVESWMSNARTSISSQLASAGGNVAFKVNAPAGGFSTNRELITLTGTAPVEAKDITLNGAVYPVTWSDLKTWSMRVALAAGTNVLAIQGLDRSGNPVTGASNSIAVRFTGNADAPAGHLAINEIMYNPTVPNAGFIEIYNSSQTTAFDLSGFALKGADFLFPGGSIIQPNGYLVIASDATAFANAYGSSIPIAGVFNGSLSNEGETLRLVRPGVTPDLDTIFDSVTYSGTTPWPVEANGSGPSLQLIDPSANHNRVVNWAAISTTNSIPRWTYVTVTGTASSSTLYLYLKSGGDVYLDDIKLVAGAVPEAGDSFIQNGDFEAPVGAEWTPTPNTSQTSISNAYKHSGNNSLHLICASGGSTKGDSLWQTTKTLTQNAQYTLSYWYLDTSGNNTLTIRLSGSGINSTEPIRPNLETAQYTPGAANSVNGSLAIPPIWLNEIAPNNVTGITDHLGHHAPWIELYNSRSTNVALAEVFLSTNYANLDLWQFPSNASIPANGFLLLYLDGHPEESSATELHTGFAVEAEGGTLVLSYGSAGQTNILDYIDYPLIALDESFGAFPDGTPARTYFANPTPGAPNSISTPVPLIYINEWMASNSKTIADPADGKFHDWFELYNSGANTADLSGFTLTDTLSDNAKSAIPQGVTIAPHGYLLVWADSALPSTNSSEVHANFNLKASGDAIGLFTPDGTLVDSVTFAAQTDDASEGRWPDGNSAPFITMHVPTPAAANRPGGSQGDSAPVLDPISDKSVVQGNTISFSVTAHDADAGQRITYSLDAGGPSDATIDPSTGAFAWLVDEKPGVYSVTIRATDNGVPPLSDSKSFHIEVFAPANPEWQSISLIAPDSVSLTWGAMPGASYKIEYKDRLDGTNWNLLGQFQPTGSQGTAVDNSRGTNTQRFYRLRSP
jgi:hypothetical protein